MPKILHAINQRVEERIRLCRDHLEPATRFIFFDIDPDTGAQSVHDIIEVNMDIYEAYPWMRIWYRRRLEDGYPYVVGRCMYHTEERQTYCYFTSSLQTKGL